MARRKAHSEHINYKGAITQTVARLPKLFLQSTSPEFDSHLHNNALSSVNMKGKYSAKVVNEMN